MALMYGVIVVLAASTCISAQTTSVPVPQAVDPLSVKTTEITENATLPDSASESLTPTASSKLQTDSTSRTTSTSSPTTVSSTISTVFTTVSPDTTQGKVTTTYFPVTTEVNITTFTPDTTKLKITTTVSPATITPSADSPRTTPPAVISTGTTVKEDTETTTETPSTTSAPPVPPKEPNTWLSVFVSVFIVLAVILLVGVGVWFIRRRRQLERLRHQLMPMYNFDPTDDVDDWENQLLEEGRSLRPEADKVQMYTGNSTFEKNQTATPTDTPAKD